MIFVVGSSGGSGGPSSSDAILTVTVPTGSTVTATRGGVTLTPTMWVQAADNTFDCALFVIAPSLFDSQNAWTVTATLGTDTASDTVTISSNEQYDVYLTFIPYLIKNGVVRTGFNFSNSVTYCRSDSKGTVITQTGKIILMSDPSWTMVYSNDSLTDLSQYSNLKATVNPSKVETTSSLNEKLRGIGVAVYSSPYPNAGASANVAARIVANRNTTTINQRQTLNCDISALTSGYIAINVGGYSGIGGQTDVYDVWLE